MDRDKNKTTIVPACEWPVKKLVFKIRKRGFVAYNDTSLLISNSLGVWSVRRRRYVRKTRFHRFTLLEAEALPVERRYASLRKLGMHSWPEYDERLALLRSRLVDTYWDAAPAWYRDDVVYYFREARRWRMQEWVMRFICASIGVVTLAAMTFLLVKKASLLGGRVQLLLITLFYILQVTLWSSIMLFKPEASALKMLEILHEDM